MYLPEELGERDVLAVINAALHRHPCATEQLERAAAWAEGVLLSAGLLRLVLDGRVDIGVPDDPDGELTWQAAAVAPVGALRD